MEIGLTGDRVGRYYPRTPLSDKDRVCSILGYEKKIETRLASIDDFDQIRERDLSFIIKILYYAVCKKIWRRINTYPRSRRSTSPFEIHADACKNKWHIWFSFFLTDGELDISIPQIRTLSVYFPHTRQIVYWPDCPIWNVSGRVSCVQVTSHLKCIWLATCIQVSLY